MIMPFVWPWGFYTGGSEGGASDFSPTLQRATPSSGDTVVVNQVDPVVTLLIEGNAPIATLSIRLPQPGASKPGQIVRVVSWIDIGDLSFGTADVGGIPTQMFTGDGIALQNIENNNWLRLP